MEYLLPASWQGVSVYRDQHICSQHFHTKDIVKTLWRIKKVVNGAFPTIFNPQEVRVNEKNNIGRRKAVKAVWSFRRKVPVCRLMSLWRIATVFFRVRTTKSVLRQLKKKINTVKKVCFCFLPNGHWSTRNGRACQKCSKIENWKQSSSKRSHFGCIFAKLHSCSTLFLSFPSTAFGMHVSRL